MKNITVNLFTVYLILTNFYLFKLPSEKYWSNKTVKNEFHFCRNRFFRKDVLIDCLFSNRETQILPVADPGIFEGGCGWAKGGADSIQTQYFFGKLLKISIKSVPKGGWINGGPRGGAPPPPAPPAPPPPLDPPLNTTTGFDPHKYYSNSCDFLSKLEKHRSKPTADYVWLTSGWTGSSESFLINRR